MTRALILSTLSCLALGACAASGTDTSRIAAAAHSEPGAAELRASIDKLIAERQGPPHSQYQFSITDLNDDGVRDALVLFNLPYGYWCGWGGCTMAVFTADNGEFALTSEVQNIRGPIVVTESKTNGWRDIVVRVSGTQMADKNVALQYQDGTYPGNPAGLTTIAQAMIEIPGDRLFP